MHEALRPYAEEAFAFHTAPAPEKLVAAGHETEAGERYVKEAAEKGLAGGR